CPSSAQNTKAIIGSPAVVAERIRDLLLVENAGILLQDADHPEAYSHALSIACSFSGVRGSCQS
ncbi:MAG TPA: hypothetical protein VI386_06690, partial [Candidatus Sulfotelmatobacter sp.]